MTTRRINASSNIDFTGSNYKIAKWTPAITRRDSSPLSLPFADVVETIEVEVTGSTATDAYDKAADMAAMLDEVTDFRNGDASAVTFDYEPPGAANGIQQALITRYLGINYPSANDIESGANQGVIAPVTIQFERRGLWLEDTEDASTQTTSAKATTIHSTAFSASHDTRCPIDLNITSASFTGLTTTYRGWNGYVFLTNSDDGLKVLDGTDCPAPSGSWSKGTSTASAAVSGSSVLKFSGTSSGSIPSIDIDTHFTTNPTKFVVYAIARQTSGSDSFMLKATGFSTYVAEDDAGEWVKCDSTATSCYRLGEYHVPSGAGYLTLFAKSSGAGSVDGEVDRLVIMKVTDESYAFRTYDKTVGSSSNSFTVDLEQQALTELSPRFGFTESSAFNRLPYDGNLNIYMSGDRVVCYFGVTDGSTWSILSDASIQVQASRRLARVIAT